MKNLENTQRHWQFLKSYEAESLRGRSFLTQIADSLNSFCGSTPFLFFHMLFFAGWILVNTGQVSTISPFDPFPFGLLTMVVSLEAIFLAIFILVSQNRISHINTIREEVHMAVNLIAEDEITKILELLAEIRKEIGIKRKDPELEQMLRRIDTGYIEQAILSALQKANQPLRERLLKQFPELLSYPVKGPIKVAQQTIKTLT